MDSRTVISLVVSIVELVAATLSTLLGLSPGFPEAYYQYIYRSVTENMALIASVSAASVY